MKKLYRFIVLGVAASSLGLTGCGLERDPAYSPGVKYGLRQDPIVLDAAKLGAERYEPDRPGVLPIMKYDDIFKPENPIFANSAKLNDSILRDPTKVPEAERRELEKALEEQFGTPANPTVNAKAAGIDDETIKKLKLDDATLKEGSRRYRVHCLHCHGVPGDGRGPTSHWINPHPRDFRAGMFKFQSVDQATDSTKRPPSRSDLLRTLRNGLEGTAMPSFGLLADEELESIISYVMHLSIRGQTEMDVIRAFFNFDKAGGLVWNRGADAEEQLDKAAAVQFFAKKLVQGGWKEANDPAKAIKVEPYPYKEGDMDAFAASVKRGKQLFLGDETHPRGKNANCKQCHEDYGRQAKFKFDDWATLVRPNNFTNGIFRGGRRPVDLYYRIHSGINGSGMTNFGRSGVLEGGDIWDLINFVQALPYPAMRDKLALKIN